MSQRAIVGGAAHALFTLPRASLWHLYEIVRDYECDELPMFERPPHVLDLGAHVGAFTMWATARWPGATVDAYEPHPMLCDLLRRNVAGEAVEVHELAVLGRADLEKLAQRRQEVFWVPLYEGKRTLLGNSCMDVGWQRVDEQPLRVRGMRAADLPPCDVMKVDIEGAEIGVLDDYAHTPTALLCELHGVEAKDATANRCKQWGLHVIRETPGRGGSVTQIWVR